MVDFLERSPTLDNYWRSIILFGRNVASYKFALAKSLLEFKQRGDDAVTLESLAEPFFFPAMSVRTYRPTLSKLRRLLARFLTLAGVSMQERAAMTTCSMSPAGWALIT